MMLERLESSKLFSLHLLTQELMAAAVHPVPLIMYCPPQFSWFTHSCNAGCHQWRFVDLNTANHTNNIFTHVANDNVILNNKRAVVLPPPVNPAAAAANTSFTSFVERVVTDQWLNEAILATNQYGRALNPNFDLFAEPPGNWFILILFMCLIFYLFFWIGNVVIFESCY